MNWRRSRTFEYLFVLSWAECFLLPHLRFLSPSFLLSVTVASSSRHQTSFLLSPVIITPSSKYKYKYNYDPSKRRREYPMLADFRTIHWLLLQATSLPYCLVSWNAARSIDACMCLLTKVMAWSEVWILQWFDLSLDLDFKVGQGYYMNTLLIKRTAFSSKIKWGIDIQYHTLLDKEQTSTTQLVPLHAT